MATNKKFSLEEQKSFFKKSKLRKDGCRHANPRNKNTSPFLIFSSCEPPFHQMLLTKLPSSNNDHAVGIENNIQIGSKMNSAGARPTKNGRKISQANV